MLMNSNEYLNIVESIKQEIRTAQYRATVSVNRELLVLYHSILSVMSSTSTRHGAANLLKILPPTLKFLFRTPPATLWETWIYGKVRGGLSGRWICATACCTNSVGTQYHSADKLSDNEERLWYAEKIAENGWSRNVLVHQIESGLYQRQVLAEKVSNFENRLPSPQSELAVQTMKNS